MLGREREGSGGRVVFDDAAGGHGGQPLANIALVEPRAVGDLLAGPRPLGGRLEEPGLVSDVHQQGEDSARVVAEELAGEILNALAIGFLVHF